MNLDGVKLEVTNFIYVDLFVNDKFNDSNWKERNSWWKKGHLTPHSFMKTLWNSYLCANKNVAEPCKLLFLFLTCAYALTYIWFICDLYSLWKIEREIILKNIKSQIFCWSPCMSEPFNNGLSWHTLIVIVHASVESQYMY